MLSARSADHLRGAHDEQLAPFGDWMYGRRDLVVDRGRGVADVGQGCAGVERIIARACVLRT
jgi:hypothetical protein